MMIEPIFLSLDELAERWKLTDRQIFEHAEFLRLPLYFSFEGLVFDINDQWHRSIGIEYQDVKDEHSRLLERVTALERLINPVAPLRKDGIFTPSEYEATPLSSEEIKKYRLEIDAHNERIEDLEIRLNERQKQRKRFYYYGHLRAVRKNISEVAQYGKSFLSIAYIPDQPITIMGLDGVCVADGHVVSLEDGRLFLTKTDLLAYMDHVKFIENGAPSKNDSTPKKITVERMEAILSGLKELGYTPDKLPRRKQGKKGPKSEFWSRYGGEGLFIGKASFNVAWQSLRDSGDIAEAQ